MLRYKQEAKIMNSYFLEKKKNYKCRCGSKLQIKFLDSHYISKKHQLYIKNQEFFNKYGYYTNIY